MAKQSTVMRAALLLGVLVVIALIMILAQPGEQAGRLRAAFGAEFLTRPDGYPGLAEHYDFRFADQPRQMVDGLMYRAVADGAVDVINGFSTDGRIPAYDLLALEDDQHFFPPYYAAPLVRRDALDRLPQLADILNRLAGRLSDETMQQLNYMVDEERRTAQDVARQWLRDEGLIDAPASTGAGAAGRVAIGSKEFTEQEIIGEMMAILIEETSDIRVDRHLNLGGTMICFNALRSGDIDLYAEYTGTGLITILGRDIITDPEETYRTVKERFAEEHSLVWLEPLGFNNTYTLTMRRAHAEELGLTTLTELAALVRQRQAE